MSKPTIISAQCPYCQAEIDIPYYEEINVSKEPEKKQAILSGDLFRFTCPHCGENIPVVGPLLYHDPAVPAILCLIPPGFDQSMDKLNEILAMIQSMEGDKASVYQVRQVDSIDKLLEKIYIQDAKLDDRVVELIKLAYLKHYGPQLQKKGKIHSSIFVPASNEEDAQIVYILGDDHDMASVDFSNDYYVYFATAYAEKLKKQEAVNQVQTIDEHWAASFIKE